MDKNKCGEKCKCNLPICSKGENILVITRFFTNGQPLNWVHEFPVSIPCIKELAFVNLGISNATVGASLADYVLIESSTISAYSMMKNFTGNTVVYTTPTFAIGGPPILQSITHTTKTNFVLQSGVQIKSIDFSIKGSSGNVIVASGNCNVIITLRIKSTC